MNKPSTVQNHLLAKSALALLLVTLMLVVAPGTAGGSQSMAMSNGYSLTHYNLSASNSAWIGGGGYSGNSALGQLEGGTAAGGGYSLVGGVLAGVQETSTHHFLPFVVR